MTNQEKFWENFLIRAPKSKQADFRESIIEHAYKLSLSDGDVAIDIGAHRGRHTIPMSACVGAKGTIHAFEAASEMQKKLRAQINRAPIPQIRNIVKYHDYALSNKDGEAEFFYLPKKGSGLSSLAKRTNYPEDAEVVKERVKVRTLDDVLPQDSPIKFIKADIEGAEYDAFLGGIKLISKARPFIAFEHGAKHDAERFGYTKNEFFDLFASIEYELITIFGRRYTRDIWGDRSGHDLFAIPKERGEEHREIIQLAILGAIDLFLSESL